MIWLTLTGVLLVLGFRLPPDLRFLRRYKYLWLTGGLILTAMTFGFGVNPLGYGPRMWLGCCGIYLQPSEPLKLLMIAFLAAYMADRQTLLALAHQSQPVSNKQPEVRSPLGGWVVPFVPLIAPSVLMIGLAVAVLAIQRDLGAAAIFLFLYAAMVYVTSQRRIVLLLAALSLICAGILGYLLFDVVSVRVEAWLNPWEDPSGQSYQIVQSLLSVANGGVIGRGPGLGSPELVPVSHSDLIFAAVIEQTGLVGALGLILIIVLMVSRGLVIAVRRPEPYLRYLAAGISAYLGAQSLLIMGGALRLLPLTGITLPFVSYGGSSLLISMLGLMLLMIMSKPSESQTQKPINPQPYLHLGLVLGVGFVVTALAAGWWAIYRAPGLLVRTDNPRRAVGDRFVRRGAVLDRSARPISETTGEPGAYSRRINYPALSNVVGYTSSTYGQSGLEESQDPFLRGLEGNPLSEVIWNELVYGQPPPGRDIRLSIDLNLQQKADQLLEGKRGALVLIDARTGEILAMASQPGFDANELVSDWEELIDDPEAPLLNRAVMGRYPIGSLVDEFPAGILAAGKSLGTVIGLQTGDISFKSPDGTGIQTYSPLQLALTAATVTAEGVRPVPRMVMAVDDSENGWTPLPAEDKSLAAVPTEDANLLAKTHALKGEGFWQVVKVVQDNQNSPLTWLIGGALPNSASNPLALAIVLERDDPGAAQLIAKELLSGF